MTTEYESNLRDQVAKDVFVELVAEANKAGYDLGDQGTQRVLADTAWELADAFVSRRYEP